MPSLIGETWSDNKDKMENWGSAAANERSRFILTRKEASSLIGGHWQVILGTLQSGWSIVRRARQQTLTVRKVLIGEVWSMFQASQIWKGRLSCENWADVLPSNYPESGGSQSEEHILRARRRTRQGGRHNTGAGRSVLGCRLRLGRGTFQKSKFSWLVHHHGVADGRESVDRSEALAPHRYLNRSWSNSGVERLR